MQWKNQQLSFWVKKNISAAHSLCHHCLATLADCAAVDRQCAAIISQSQASLTQLRFRTSTAHGLYSHHAKFA